MNTYFVGIDIAKFKHDCFIADSNGCVIRDSFSFPNNLEGFNLILSILNNLKLSGNIKIGFESTGHYHNNLKLFLEKNGFTFMELNPLLVHKFVAAQTLRRTKTDKKDAQMISLYLMTIEYKPYVNSFYHIYGLKSLCRQRESFITQRTRISNDITALLDQLFPEFKPFFEHKLSKTALYLLNNYLTPSHISKLNIESYNNMKSALKRTISYIQFQHLREIAKKTIGISNELLEFQLKELLIQYNSIDSQIESIEEIIVKYYRTLDCHIHTIKGVSEISAASIVSEIGDISKFNNPNQLLAYAGLEPGRFQSGTIDNNGKMVKHGSSQLRMVIYRCSETLYVHNPVISEYYWKKRSEGKHHNVALSHVARKLINIIFKLETCKIDFDINLLK